MPTAVCTAKRHGFLAALDGIAECAIEKEIREAGIALERGRDIAEQRGANNAARAPDLGDIAGLKLVLIVVRCNAHEREPLRVGSDLARVKRVLHGLDEFVAIAFVRGRGAVQYFAGRYALRLQRRKNAAFDGGIDRRDRRADVERVLAGPLPGSLLRRGIDHQVHERLAGQVVNLRENFGGDLDEIRFQFAGVPLGENLVEFAGGRPRPRLKMS